MRIILFRSSPLSSSLRGYGQVAEGNAQCGEGRRRVDSNVTARPHWTAVGLADGLAMCPSAVIADPRRNARGRGLAACPGPAASMIMALVGVCGRADAIRLLVLRLLGGQRRFRPACGTRPDRCRLAMCRAGCRGRRRRAPAAHDRLGRLPGLRSRPHRLPGASIESRSPGVPGS